ncbi:peroxisome biogenesis factor 10 [Centropristis striata]|uniref:peroxisome biogenesis factor 10 n=1 Tax=Centropristis striata TaxID=184440 RepID=UPI0027DF01D2|nr:peroxisome biogenesis factor 10 [Centropristis striata]
MPLSPANQSHLIRSSQKDQFYQNLLRNNTNEAFQTLAGRFLSQITCQQTLGEEYVNVVQVDSSRRQIPSGSRRLLLVLLRCWFPHLLDRVLVCLETQLTCGQQQVSSRSRSWSLESWIRRGVQRALGLLPEHQRRGSLPVLLVLDQGLTLLNQLHTALFYITGSFYQLSERITGIHYLPVRGPSSDDGTIRTSYRLLGLLSLLQILITVCLQLNNYRQKHRARTERSLARTPSPQISPSSSGSRASSCCMLCLEERRRSTATPCGHLFCWDCITEWTNTKAECPLCRAKFQPHRLVYLRNYS